ncbi:MAG: BrnT family toxin [Opitutaceae bacterium]
MERVKFARDSRKNAAHLVKHGISLADDTVLWRGTVVTLPSSNPGEMRHLAIGFIAGKLWTVVYAPRDDPFQLISARRSRNHEKDSSSKPPGPTTAANPERRFNRGRDVFDYFDAARAVVTHGGVRPGAGRKPSGKLRKTVKLTPGAIRRFRAFARREKLADFSSALEAASRLV